MKRTVTLTLLVLSGAKLVIGTETDTLLENQRNDRDWETSVQVCYSKEVSSLRGNRLYSKLSQSASPSAARIICTVTLNLTLINLDRFSFGVKTFCTQ